ncbi:MAG TPA: glycoside hydrolase family 30 beta sandwich domain-containing protein [Terriglobales bacterium]|jgi:glucosylceramidase|nr:glycoside hydrolase family 30 beta sandwich domain-containing protein [Terriglobales bacterium]
MRSRRAFLKLSALGMGAVGAGISLPSSASAGSLDGAGAVSHIESAPPVSDISVWLTNNKQRFAAAPVIPWRALTTTPSMGPPTTISSSAITSTPDFVRLIVANKFQDILGFGGCFSDASCYVIDKLPQPVRDQLLHELCHPSEMGLNVHRTCIGSADSAASLYSYDDGDADPELRRFSIDHDRAYILPVLRKVREINPEVFLFSSPWSPPGWMKWNKSMLGGSMSRQYLASYAQYFLKFLQAYAEAGVPVQAITTQNEIDTDQHGQMPACTWSQECESEFITDHIGPLFEKTNTSTRIWILDHNFVYWGRVISQLDDPDFRQYVNAVAFHPYTGEPSMMSKVHAAHPGVELHFTEGSTDYNDPHYQDDWTKWSTTYTAAFNNWCRSAVAWNVATDEHGKPNIGPYPCGGILIVNPNTQEIIRSGQYWALAHFSRSVRRGARRFESQSLATNLSHIAFENPDGQKVLVLTNTGPARTVEVTQGVSSAAIPLEGNSIATLVWK